jgi:hypothetical protein
LFLLTCLYALLRLACQRMRSRSLSSTLLASVLFPVILLSVSPPAYPSCSALSLCGQPLPCYYMVLWPLLTSHDISCFNRISLIPSLRP